MLPSLSQNKTPSARQALRRALFFGVALVLLWGATRLAAAPKPPSPPQATVTGAASPKLLTPGYAVTLLLLAGGGAFAFYLKQRTRPTGNGGACIETLGQAQLAPNQQLRLVACGGEVLLLGVTAGQITLLKTFPQDAFAEEPAAAEETPALPGFTDLLRQHLGHHE